MGIFNPSSFASSLLFLIILCDHPALADDENGFTGGDIANYTNAPPPPPPPAESRTTSFKPGIAVIVGILTTIFSITFLLLLYVKHCKRSTYAAAASRGHPPSRRNSGIDRKVIESLPMFRFSSLRGQKDGLECAVCLNRFEPEEVLRLLPKCKHAFHVECVDTWLDAHSTCPLCRYRVHAEDVLLLDGGALCGGGDSASATPRGGDTCRVSGRHSSAGERGGSLEIIVENPAEDFRGRVSLDSWKSRRKSGSWRRDFRRKEKEKDSAAAVAENQARKSRASRKDGQLPVAEGEQQRRLDHRIIISGDGEGRRRWSDAEATELLYLRSEMLLGGGGEGDDRSSGTGVINGRSVSEITGVSRYRGNNGGREKEERERQEEGVVKRWLAWISQSQQQQQQGTAVNSAGSSSPPSQHSATVL